MRSKLAVPLAIFLAVISFSIAFANKDIFPSRQVEKIVEVKGSGPIGSGQTYKIKKTVEEPSQWDGTVKLALLLILAVSYWMILGAIVANQAVRLLVFVVSVPLGYVILVYIGFIFYFTF